MLKNGVPDGKGGVKGGYRFSGNTYEIFEKFFGTSNPFTVSLDGKFSMYICWYLFFITLEKGNSLSLIE